MNLILKTLIVALFSFVLTSCQNSSTNQSGEVNPSNNDGVNNSDAQDSHEKEKVHGDHGGTLLSKNDFSIELKIFESGTAPHFRVYAYDKGKPLSPSQFSIQVAISRLAKKKQVFTFEKANEFYLSNEEVAEPHSFTIEVAAKYHDKDYKWKYDSFEGRTTIPDNVAKISGIKTEKAQLGNIGNVIKIRGNILPSEHRIAHVTPRFSGVVREGRKHIGDKVEKGEVLAIIESNQSLQPFEVKSQISGTVINGHVIPGEFVPDSQWIYIVADISEVWGDFYVPISKLSTIKMNQKINIHTLDGEKNAEGVISYIAPYVDENSQSQMVRVNIENSAHLFLPGMFVIGEITSDETDRNVVIKKSAVQNYNNHQSVFFKSGEIYEVRPIEIGKSNEGSVEVISGIAQGEEYVYENSFLIKADILKSGASHDH